MVDQGIALICELFAGNVVNATADQNNQDAGRFAYRKVQCRVRVRMFPGNGVDAMPVGPLG